MEPGYIKYRTGYSIGTGGIVLRNNQVLLVRHAAGSRAGVWALPGGYIEHEETAHVAAQREVLEETGVTARVEGLLAVLHGWIKDENGVYLMFLMRAVEGEPRCDGIEVDDARFFALEDLQELPRLERLTRLVITPVLKGEMNVLPYFPYPDENSQNMFLYAGESVHAIR
jgi:ADP-ribose pyrophosphatase YjhB (NUDIX family)